MQRDLKGNPVVYAVYDRSKKRSGGIGWHRVATFVQLENAERFLKQEGNEDYFISCNTATVQDIGLARDY